MQDRKQDHSIEAALRERVKELSCLYGISELVLQDDLSLDEFLNGVVQLIPPAWQYPEHTAARIVLNDRQFVSRGFSISRFCMSERIMISGKVSGAIEVFYDREFPRADEGPFLNEERKLLEVIVSKVTLVIERREAEEKMSSLQKQVRHADRLATIGEFTAGIAHEMNEPLGNILGFAQLAIKQDLPPPAKLDLEKIIKSALNAREIIKKLMYFSRQVPQRFERTDLNQVVREAMYFLEPRCAKENIIVSYELSHKLPLIVADAVQLTQVIVNLVVNAIQAMEGGGKLIISSFVEGNSVILAVEDTGTGITEEVKPHIFRPFFTTKEVSKGTGLGLAVVHGIMMGHKGDIHVRSESGKGTRFEVKFPVKAD